MHSLRTGTTRLDLAENTVSGTVFTPQAFVRIHWAWMAMLAVQLLLTTMFLAATIAETYASRMQVIKSSSLATLCALDRTTRRRVGGLGDIDELTKGAKDTEVRLERDASGVALWLGR